VFGDYEPFSAVTVDRKYFTSDPALFLEIFKNITCENGGMVKNAIEEGMVAALEVRNKPSIIQYIDLCLFLVV
jgi:hypothetical protein